MKANDTYGYCGWKLFEVAKELVRFQDRQDNFERKIWPTLSQIGSPGGPKLDKINEDYTKKVVKPLDDKLLELLPQLNQVCGCNFSHTPGDYPLTHDMHDDPEDDAYTFFARLLKEVCKPVPGEARAIGL